MKPDIHLVGLFTLLCSQVLTIGATQSLEILRDLWGTPHVFAAAEADGFFGLGYAAAEDRLLQMELIRRKAAGRLAEAFGPEWVDSDREARIAGHFAYPRPSPPHVAFTAPRARRLDRARRGARAHPVR